MRVLIIGATGLLGKALLGEWDFDEVTGASSRDADIREPAQLRALFARRTTCSTGKNLCRMRRMIQLPR